MRNVLFLISMLLGVHSLVSAQTTVYHYVSKPYVAFDALSPDSDVVFAPFTSSMQLRGSITVAKPFPGNLQAEPIGPETAYPVTWSFHNGLSELTHAEHYLAGALVSTNANGEITRLGLNGLSSKPPYSNGQKLSGFIILFSSGGVDSASEGASEGFVFTDLLCTTDTNEQCHELDISKDSSAAVLPMGGSWSQSTEASTQVPGLGGFALGLGALMLGLVVRRSPAVQKPMPAH